MRYFGSDTLYGDTLEINAIYTRSERTESVVIERYISPTGLFRSKDSITPESLSQFLADLHNMGISNIILLKEADYLFYENIFSIALKYQLLEIKIENQKIIVYTF